MFAKTLNEQLQVIKKLSNSHQKVQALTVLTPLIERSSDRLLIAEFLLLKVQSYREKGSYIQVEQVLTELINHAQSHDLLSYFAIIQYEKGELLKTKGLYAQALIPLHDALKQFIQLDMFEYQSKALRKSAYCLRSIGQHKQALVLALQARNIALEHKLTKELSHVNRTTSDIYAQLGLHEEAWNLQLTSFNAIDGNEKNSVANAGEFYSLAQKYLDLEQFSDAIKYFLVAYQKNLSAERPIDIGHSQVKLAQSYLGDSQYQQAMKFAQLSLVTFTAMQVERHIAWARSNIGDIYLAQQKYSQALVELTAAEKTLTLLTEKQLLNTVKLSLGKTLLALQQTVPAQHYFEQALSFSDKQELYPIKVIAIEKLIIIYESKHLFSQALQYQKQLQKLLLLHIKEVHSYRSVILKNSFDDISKNSQIDLLKSEKALNNIKYKQKKSAMNLAVSLAVIGALLLFISLYFHVIKRRFNFAKQALLNKSLEERNRLFTDISHELRTPLSVLKLQIQALEYNLTNNKSVAFDKLHEKISDLDRLITDIHQLANLDAHSLQLNIKSIDVNRSINDVVANLKILANQYKLSFSYENHISESLTFKGDYDRLQQVFLNIMQNSMKYTDFPGQVKLIMKTEKKQLILSLEDSKPCVSKDALPFIFDRLYRENSSKSSDAGGSGLGLSIAKGIVELHKGSIDAVQSELGGLKVIVKLPLSD